MFLNKHYFFEQEFLIQKSIKQVSPIAKQHHHFDYHNSNRFLCFNCAKLQSRFIISQISAWTGRMITRTWTHLKTTVFRRNTLLYGVFSDSSIALHVDNSWFPNKMRSGRARLQHEGLLIQKSNPVGLWMMFGYDCGCKITVLRQCRLLSRSLHLLQSDPPHKM